MGEDNQRISISDIEILDKVLTQKNDVLAYVSKKQREAQKARMELIENIIVNSENIVQLHEDLQNISDQVNAVTSTLCDFYNNLEDMNSQMRCIQTRCSRISVDLKGRLETKEYLKKFVDKLIVPERMITAIISSDINEQEFIDQMNELNLKIEGLKELKTVPLNSSRESEEIIENLKNKFFLNRLNTILTAPENFGQAIKSISSIGEQLVFLRQHDPNLFKQCINDYLQMTRKVLTVVLKEYFLNIMKMYDPTLNVTYVITDISKSNPKIEQSFMLGNRSVVLTDLTNESLKLISNVTQKSNVEHVVQSVCCSIFLNTAAEYEFLTNTLGMEWEMAVNETYRTFSFSLDIAKVMFDTILSESKDLIGLLIGLSILKRYQMLFRFKTFHKAEKQFLEFVQSFWGKFHKIILSCTQNLAEYAAITTVSYDECHLVTRRVSGLLAAIYGVLPDFEPNTLLMNFTHIIQEWENFIMIQASVFDKRKEQLVYQIVNYNMVLNMISAQSHIPLVAGGFNISVIHQDSSRLCGEVVKELKKRYKNMINQLCLEELAPFFERIVSFTNCHSSSSKVQPDEIIQLSTNFSSTWKNAIMVIAVDVKKLFAPSYIDQEIKEVCLSMLIDYYKKFVSILTNHYPDLHSSLVSKGKIIDVHQILVEIKKYR